MSFFKNLFGGKKEEDKAQPEAPRAESRTSSGTAAVENGKIIVKNPVGSEVYATIYIPEDEALTVTVNGEEKTGEVVVDESQKIEAFFASESEEAPSCELRTSVSKDRLSVMMTKDVVFGRRLALAKTEPRKSLELRIVEEDAPPAPLSREDVHSSVAAAGYKGEIDEQAAQEIAEAPDSKEVKILSGIPAVPGRSAFYKKVVEMESDEINFVRKGDILGIYEKEVPGTAGKDVYGETIPVAIENRLQRLSPGVKEANGKIEAQKDGRLVFDDKEIDVVPQLIIERDLTEEDGEILFDEGDVIVKGSVTENCLLRVGGLVDVQGGVYNSSIYAEEGVVAKGNISNSHIYAGTTLIFYKKLNAAVEKAVGAANQFGNAREEAAELHAQGIAATREKDPIRDAGKALDAAFAKLEQFEKEELLEKDDVFKRVMSHIRAKWNLIARKDCTAADARKLAQALGICLQSFAGQLERRPATIKAESVTNSQVDASGSVHVGKSGVYLSRIDCGGELQVKGVSRGGELYAQTSAEIFELISYNTQNAHDFKVRVRDAEGYIKIGKRHADTLLEIADRKDVSDDMQANVNFKYNSPQKKR